MTLIHITLRSETKIENMFNTLVSLSQSSPYSVPTFIFSVSFSVLLYMMTEPKQKSKDRDINGVGSLLRNDDSILKDVDGRCEIEAASEARSDERCEEWRAMRGVASEATR